MASVAVRISNLNPFVGAKIKGTDIVPISVLNLDGITYSTRKVPALQIKTYVAELITDQLLFTNSNVTFNSLTATDSVSSVNISATNFFGRGANLTNVFNQDLNTTNSVKFNTISATGSIKIGQQSVVSKFIGTINHPGSPLDTLYIINHPFLTTDVIVQIYEVAGGGVSDLTVNVLTDIVNKVGATTGITEITLSNPTPANYKVLIMG